MFRIIIFVTVMLLASHQAFAVEVKQGVLYEQGTLIESSQLGVAFTIPQGWQGAWPNGSHTTYMPRSLVVTSLVLNPDPSFKIR